jgi:hypothetical protein
MTTDNDKEALELAMQILARHRVWGPALEERLKGKRYANPHPTNGEWILKPEPWEVVAKFAAGICQRDSLNLSPWESTPCHAHRDVFNNDGSIELRDRMVAAGVSIWHPDPPAALAEVEGAIMATRHQGPGTVQ